MFDSSLQPTNASREVEFAMVVFEAVLQDDVVLFQGEAHDSVSGADAAVIAYEVPVWMRFEGLQNVGFLGEHLGQHFRFFLVVKAQEFRPLDVKACHVAIVGDDGEARVNGWVDRLIRDPSKVFSQSLASQVVFPDTMDSAKPHSMVCVDEGESRA